MKICAEIRHDNLLAVIEMAGSIQAVADRLGKDHAQISQLKTRAKHSKSGQPRVIGDDTARLIEEKFELEIGWMDNPHEKANPVVDSAVTTDETRVVYPWNSQPITWPFHGVTQDEYKKLAEFDRGQVEGFIKGLLQAGQQQRKSNGATS